MGLNTVYYQGRYYQGNMPDGNADAILKLRDYTVVSSLRHSIKDVPKHLIQDIIEETESYINENGTSVGYKKDYSDNLGVGTLRDEQTIGVAFAYYGGSVLLSDEVGLGKTVQMAGLINVLAKEKANSNKGKFRYIFFAEKASAGQLRDKLIQFTGEYVGLVSSAENENIEDLISKNKNGLEYGIVATHACLTNPTFITFLAKSPVDLIIFDESGRLKNKASEMYKNCKVLFKLHKRKVLLNATPIEISLRDMYNQLDLLDPNYMPTVQEFEREFVKKSRAQFGFKEVGFKNADKFKEAIGLICMGRTRKSLGAEYVDNVYKTILVPLSPEQKKLMKKTQLYKMVVDYPTGVDRNVEFSPKTTPKLEVLFRILEDRVKIGHTQAIVYCNFVGAQAEIASMLEEQGFRVAIINGSTKTKERKEIIENYNEGEYDILITNVNKGIDLNTSDTAVLYTLAPNPQIMVQFEGRMTREFNVKSKAVYLLVAMGKEKKFLEDKLKMRANMSAMFTTGSQSMVIEALTDGEEREIYNAETFNED